METLLLYGVIWSFLLLSSTVENHKFGRHDGEHLMTEFFTLHKLSLYEGKTWAWIKPDFYLLLFGVELEALSEGAGLRLMVLLSVQIHTLSIRDVLFLSVSKQTAGIRTYTGDKSLTRPAKHVCYPMTSTYLFCLCKVFFFKQSWHLYHLCHFSTLKYRTSKKYSKWSFFSSITENSYRWGFIAIHFPVELISHYQQAAYRDHRRNIALNK